MGMTYKQFWEEDCLLVIPYRKAYVLRQEEQNRAAWLQGVYFLKALQGSALYVQGFMPKGAKIEPFPQQPIDFTSKAQQSEQERIDDEAKREAGKIKRGMMDFMLAQQAEKKKKELADVMAENPTGKE